MNEIRAILDAVDRADTRRPLALATVVRVQGSAYRRPGARMLLLPDGEAVGTVSGGCLEGDVKFRGWRLTAEGRPCVLRYDSTSTGEIAWQLGLGCQGIVDVLVERISTLDINSPLETIRRWLEEKRGGVIARVVAAHGEADVGIGAWAAYDDDGFIAGDLAFSLNEIERIAIASLQEGGSSLAIIDGPHGAMEVFFEVIRPPMSLLVCGAGHDAIPLAAMAKTLGWDVTVIDPRPTYATRHRFPTADAVLIADPESLLPASRGGRRELTSPNKPRYPTLPTSAAAVIMSHNYSNDRVYLQALLSSPVRYVGVLGPRKRTERLLAELSQSGFAATKEQLDRLYGPVGLDLGAETPEEIALAVVAEIQAVFAGRNAGFLRASPHPIHDRTVAAISFHTGVEQGEACCLREVSR